MKNLARRNYIDFLLIGSILIVSFFVRILWLASIPTNISGDEVTNLSDVYIILFGKGYNFFSFMGDGSVAGLQFFWSALFVKLLGLGNTIFSLRLSIATLSILSLIPFYLILKGKTSRLISFIFTLLLSANYVFLNFSRTAWINMGVIFSGLVLLFCIEKADRTKHALWYLLAGAFAGITLYGYHYGRILVLTVFLYFTFKFFNKEYRDLSFLKNFFLFAGTTFVIFLPFLIRIVWDDAEAVLRRPLATYAFSREKILKTSATRSLLAHQIKYTFRGFILLDNNVMSESIESMRYVPFHTSPVNIPIKLLFLFGLIYAFIFVKRFFLWWLVFLSILMVQILSESPPNFSRGLFYLLFIYYICGIFMHEVLFYLKRYFSKKVYYILPLLLLVSGIFLSLFDVNFYFQWMKTKGIYDARQPAINYQEFSIWQAYQVQRIKQGLNPITNYEWYEIRKRL